MPRDIELYIRRNRFRYRCLGIMVIQPRLKHCCFRPRIFHDSSHERPNTTTPDACEQGLRPMPPEQVESESALAMPTKASLARNPDISLVRLVSTMLIVFACERRVRYDQPVHGSVDR